MDRPRIATGPWREALGLAAVLGAAMVLRLLLLPMPALQVDILWFGRWAATLQSVPLGDFYVAIGTDCDYLPGFLYVLAVIGRFASQAGVSFSDSEAFALWVKLVAVASDALLGVAVYRLARLFTAPSRALIAVALVIFNPGLVWVSAIWGQVDSLAVAPYMMSLASLMAGGPLAAAVWSGVAFVVKPQYAPFLLVAGVAYLRLESARLPRPNSRAAAFLWARWAWVRVALPVVVLVATVQALLLPFSVSLWPMGSASWTLYDRLTVADEWYQVTSYNAHNLWATAIAGLRLPDSDVGWFSLSYRTWGFLLLGALTAAALALAWIRAADPSAVLWGCFLVSYGAFELLTRMHERYLFMAIPLVVVAAVLRPWMIRFYAATTAVYLLNLAWNYFAPDQPRILTPAESATVVAWSAALSILPLAASPVALLVLLRRRDPTSERAAISRRGAETAPVGLGAVSAPLRAGPKGEA